MSEEFEVQDEEESAGSFVRPFLVTAGRTQSAVEGLRLETLIERTDIAAGSLKFEAASVYEMCGEATAIAELSARLKLPTATIKVVVGDLINSGHVKQHKTIGGSDGAGENEIEIITRLKEGVRRL